MYGKVPRTFPSYKITNTETKQERFTNGLRKITLSKKNASGKP